MLEISVAHINFFVLAFVNIILDENCTIIPTLHPCELGFFAVCHWTYIRFDV